MMDIMGLALFLMATGLALVFGYLGVRLATSLLKPPLEILQAELTGDGSFVDVRFRMNKLGKFRGKCDAYLVDEASGERVTVATTPKIGTLYSRWADGSPTTGYVLFLNSRGVVKEGSYVTVVFGNFVKKHVMITGS